MTFSGRLPLLEDDLQWQTTFGGIQTLVEGDIWWKTPLVGDEFRKKAKFGIRQPSVEDVRTYGPVYHVCLEMLSHLKNVLKLLKFLK